MSTDFADVARKDVSYARTWEPGGPNWLAMRAAGLDPARDGAVCWLRAVESLLLWSLTTANSAADE